MSPAHSKSHLWDRSLLPRVPERLGKGCHKFWEGGARAGTVAEGRDTAQALEITEPSALSFPHQQPTASLTPHSGFVLEREAQGGHIGKTPLGAALLQGRFPEQQLTFFFFFFLPLPSLLLLTFLFLFQTEVSETPSLVLLRKEGSPRALRARCAARPSGHRHRSPPSAQGTCPHLQSCGC